LRRIKKPMCRALQIVLFTVMTGSILAQHRPTLEPHVLAGKRLVFTNWYFVRPPFFDWVNDKGESVYISATENFGLYGAEFVTRDVSFGVKFFVEECKPELPLFKNDKPWDKWGIRLFNLIYYNGKYRMWGRCYTDNLSGRPCYFESLDGIHWEKPNLGLVEFEGNRNNNLLPTELNFSIFIDQIAPPEERYKTLLHITIEEDHFQRLKKTRPWYIMVMQPGFDKVHAIGGAVSPDGFHWKQLEDPISIEHGDTQNICYYDEKLGKYVLYTRQHMVEPGHAEEPFPHLKLHKHISRRAIGRAESETFREFPISEIILETSPDMNPSDEFYTNCYTTIPGAPDHHLMFPMVYNKAMDEQSKILFYSSYNGKTWHKVPGPPVLQTQPYGQPYGGMIKAHANLVERPNGDWILPFTGNNVPHKYPRRGAYQFTQGLLVWPKGRLTGIQTPEIGEFASIAFILPGRSIKVNALTKRTGYILVEAVDFEGNPLEGRSFEDCDPIIGDQYRRTVTWKGNSDLGVEIGTPVYFRFKMKFAKLYSLDFE
jgi:hypothetical protein